MKYLLIIFLLLSPSVSWSENVIHDDFVFREGLYYKKFTDVPFTGPFNGNLIGLSTGNVLGKAFGQLVNGKREGEWIAYHNNGQLLYKGGYIDGKLEGEWVKYFDNGKLEGKSNYKDGKLIKTIKP